MKINGIQMLDGSVVENLTIASGTSFPPAVAAGELFYKTGTSPGLYVYDGTDWAIPGADDAPEEPSSIVGEIKLVAFSAAPTKWLSCDGASVSRTQWPDLFAALGTTYGGSGTTFNLPDLRNRVPMQVGTGSLGVAVALGGTGGTGSHSAEFTLDVSQLPAHTHDGTSGAFNVSLDEADSPAPTRAGHLATPASSGTSITDIYRSALGPSGTVALAGFEVQLGETGDGAPVTVDIDATLPPYVGMNYIIYAGTEVV